MSAGICTSVDVVLVGLFCSATIYNQQWISVIKIDLLCQILPHLHKHGNELLFASTSLFLDSSSVLHVPDPFLFSHARQFVSFTFLLRRHLKYFTFLNKEHFFTILEFSTSFIYLKNTLNSITVLIQTFEYFHYLYYRYRILESLHNVPEFGNRPCAMAGLNGSFLEIHVGLYRSTM